ncbi:MAG: histidine kinase dimerization/phospho-acceptor domain-containing protein [Verrucomicrobiota bacterium]|nr:HAMP domain-containing protein [Verrucomicrobiota bacterium]MCC6823205.1 HAMP domain-containing protein [Limisphaerales bacterium]
MKSLRWRLAAWFGVSVLLLLTLFVGFTYYFLNSELHHKTWQRDYPDHPDWKLHGSYSEAEIADIMGELIEISLLYGLPLTLAAILIGFALANHSLRPIARLNEQLQTIRAPDLSRRIDLPEADAEFRGLVKHLNELLGRLDRAFTDMSEYAAKVAHELRTPLAILRLKVEQGGERVPPELAEHLQTELHHLTHVIDQSLLIAKADQGRLELQLHVFDLALLVADVAEDFALLAQDNARMVKLLPLDPSPVLTDPKHARQILHNLFTNALKHGQGNIHVRLARRRDRVVLIIANGRTPHSALRSETLGLGLRVVTTLIGLQPEIEYRRRCGKRDYLVRLSFPIANGPVINLTDPLPFRPAADPVI